MSDPIQPEYVEQMNRPNRLSEAEIEATLQSLHAGWPGAGDCDACRDNSVVQLRCDRGDCQWEPMIRAQSETALRQLCSDLAAATAEIAALRAAVRDAAMSLATYGIGSEWELRHAEVIARAGCIL